MARPISLDHDAAGSPRQERRLARSTARAFAAAVSALLVTTLVIDRSASAINTTGTEAANSFTSGTIALTDDDSGRSLFDLEDMAPGRPVERCLTITYEGSILPVDITLAADVNGPLAEHLLVEVDEGTGGGFESCTGFTPAGSVFDGTLAEMADDTRFEPMAVGRVLNADDQRTFRFRFDLADTSDALDLAASAEFVWEVTPS